MCAPSVAKLDPPFSLNLSWGWARGHGLGGSGDQGELGRAKGIRGKTMGMRLDIRNGNGTEECMEVIGNKREPKGIGLGGGGQRKKKSRGGEERIKCPIARLQSPFLHHACMKKNFPSSTQSPSVFLIRPRWCFYWKFRHLQDWPRHLHCSPSGSSRWSYCRQFPEWISTVRADLHYQRTFQIDPKKNLICISME